MPSIATEALYGDIPLEPLRKKWTRAECAAFEATGLWNEQKLELIEGELINKMGKNPPHSVALGLVRLWLGRVFGEQYFHQEISIDVAPEDNPTSEPEPDLIVLARPFWEFRNANPQPRDIRLALEVSDSMFGFDLTVKAALYARAGIVECWVFDVKARRLIVHRNPQQGVYQSIVVYTEQESVSPLASPDQTLRLSDVFNPPAAS